MIKQFNFNFIPNVYYNINSIKIIDNVLYILYNTIDSLKLLSVNLITKHIEDKLLFLDINREFNIKNSIIIGNNIYISCDNNILNYSIDCKYLKEFNIIPDYIIYLN